jgi:hypothetical protein
MSGFSGIKRKAPGSTGAGGAAAAPLPDLSPFRYTEIFGDENADYPTTVTLCSDDFWFLGGLLQLRKLYKYVCMYALATHS